MIATRVSFVFAALWVAAGVQAFPAKEPTNAAIRACAKGFTQWCTVPPPKRDDYQGGIANTLLDPEDGVLGDGGVVFGEHGTVGREGPIFGNQDLTGKNGPIFGGVTGSKRDDSQGVTDTLLDPEDGILGRWWCRLLGEHGTNGPVFGGVDQGQALTPPTPTNAAERACAKGFTQWCTLPPPKRDEDNQGITDTLLDPQDGVLGDGGVVFGEHGTVGREGPIFGNQDITGKNGPIFGGVIDGSSD
ncbi:hypothetical protein NM688_g7627 [Phlebia brevispora]|uniref:Uncharacterized protein n=1 Tax=Phlebia brevispora TaxID=194682 RepID=A0ACC1S304_9APHY|nr:hypothetical protein NM688_g7627 [Phlebia brevispora]